MIKTALVFVSLCCALALVAWAQQTPRRAATPPADGVSPILAPYLQRVRSLSSDPKIAAAFDFIDKNREETLREWTAITEINAPSGKEQERAAYIEKILRGYRLDRVYKDSTGNLIAVRKGTGGGPTVVIDAHMDTVFQPGLKIKAEIRGGRIYAPGVGDDTRNIEAILAAIRALNHADIKTKGDLIFLFTVEEETSLRGAEEFVKENKGRIDQYIALDGGYEGLTYGGIGINWYRHHFVGPGGHTRSATPPYSATLPLARAIARIYELPLPSNPPTHLNIGMLGGSEVVNAKAADAWFTVDLRSTSNEVIGDLEKKIATIAQEEAARERMTLKTDVISVTPAAQLPGHRDSPLVRTAEAVHIALGFERPPVTIAGSNNSSAALLAGIPAISTGAAPCGDSHALTEWCEIEPIYHGIKKVLLLGVATAQKSN
ncbi:MAG TPA: M20/M25/M40 family metallo-hydrolase [Pyrinomonadaceae bacterium]|jgi:acetylornithine deacetylase/succinyl-diaminopimelate desuccinylase-like protein